MVPEHWKIVAAILIGIAVFVMMTAYAFLPDPYIGPTIEERRTACSAEGSQWSTAYGPSGEPLQRVCTETGQ